MPKRSPALADGGPRSPAPTGRATMATPLHRLRVPATITPGTLPRPEPAPSLGASPTAVQVTAPPPLPGAPATGAGASPRTAVQGAADTPVLAPRDERIISDSQV